jgi:hypothetical protein
MGKAIEKARSRIARVLDEDPKCFARLETKARLQRDDRVQAYKPRGRKKSTGQARKPVKSKATVSPADDDSDEDEVTPAKTPRRKQASSPADDDSEEYEGTQARKPRRKQATVSADDESEEDAESKRKRLEWLREQMAVGRKRIAQEQRNKALGKPVEESPDAPRGDIITPRRKRRVSPSADEEDEYEDLAGSRMLSDEDDESTDFRMFSSLLTTPSTKRLKSSAESTPDPGLGSPGNNARLTAKATSMSRAGPGSRFLANTRSMGTARTPGPLNTTPGRQSQTPQSAAAADLLRPDGEPRADRMSYGPDTMRGGGKAVSLAPEGTGIPLSVFLAHQQAVREKWKREEQDQQEAGGRFVESGEKALNSSPHASGAFEGRSPPLDAMQGEDIADLSTITQATFFSPQSEQDGAVGAGASDIQSDEIYDIFSITQETFFSLLSEE